MAKRVAQEELGAMDVQCRYCDQTFPSIRSRGAHESHHTRTLMPGAAKALRLEKEQERTGNLTPDALLTPRERAHRNGTTIKEEIAKAAVVVDNLSGLQAAIRKSLDGVVLGVVVVTLEDWQAASAALEKAAKWDKLMTVAPSFEGLLNLIQED